MLLVLCNTLSANRSEVAALGFLDPAAFNSIAFYFATGHFLGVFLALIVFLNLETF